MKTYHEMTESVLEKAGTEILKKERRRRNGVFIAASGLCFALLLTVLGMGMGQRPTVVPTQPEEQPGLSADATVAPKPTDATQPPEQKSPTVKITYLTNVAGETTQETVSPGVKIPLDARLRVRDTRGLSEEDVKKVMQEEETIGSEYISSGEGSLRIASGWDITVSIASKGYITLDLRESSTVKDIKVETTEVGSSTGRSMKLSQIPPEGHPFGTPNWPYVLEVYLSWDISNETFSALSEDPTMPLSTIRDTMTVTINYENGTNETLIFDITLDDEGQIFVTQRGIPTEVA